MGQEWDRRKSPTRKFCVWGTPPYRAARCRTSGPPARRKVILTCAALSEGSRPVVPENLQGAIEKPGPSPDAELCWLRVVNSLCRGQEKRTICKPKVQV